MYQVPARFGGWEVMDIPLAKFWLEIIALCINLGLWFYVWRSNKDKATRAHIEDHALELGRVDERLKNALDQKALAPLYNKVNTVEKQMSELQGSVKASTHTLNLIHEMLLYRKGGDK